MKPILPRIEHAQEIARRWVDEVTHGTRPAPPTSAPEPVERPEPTQRPLPRPKAWARTLFDIDDPTRWQP